MGYGDFRSARLGIILRSRVGLGLHAILMSFINPWLALPLLLLAEILERQLFSQSVYAPKMQAILACYRGIGDEFTITLWLGSSI